LKESTACSRELGYELRRRRDTAGMTATELAELMGWTHSKMSRLETGLRSAAETDVVQYLAHLGYSYNDMRPLRALCRESARDLGYWLASPLSLAFHESTAAICTSYHPEEIPAPLQVGDETPQRPNPHRTYLLHERALRDRTELEQALKLLLLADLPHITIQIVPGGQFFGSAFRLLQHSTYQPLVYVEGHHIGLFLEDAEYVRNYLALTTQILQAAMDPDKTRDKLVELAAHAQLARR
jgi:transcriptional regulator with XRE-family HTH domain